MKKKEKKGPDAITGIGNAFSSAYQKVPEFPYLDRATTLILIVCLVGYFGFTAYIFFSMPPIEIEARLLEGTLSKNSPLALAAGEHYAYVVKTPEGDRQIDYFVSASQSCQGLMVQEQSGQASQDLCILKNGLLSGESVNVNYGNRSILLFSPWMLAASENFNWTVDSVYSAHGAEMAISTRFESKGKQAIAGREAYEIEVGDNTGTPTAHFFVDSQKRVLLYADMGNVTVTMEKAPFELNWTNH
jgi:hypothetical protein